MFSLSAANAGNLIAVPEYPGGTLTDPFAINNSNNIAGAYTDASGVEHGFYGTLAGSYTSFDYTLGSGVSATLARGMDDNGNITGYAPGGDEGVGYEWEMANGVMSSITRGNNPTPLDGIAQQISTNGYFAGDYQAPRARYAYVGKTSAVLRHLPLEFNSTEMAGRGINTSGEVVGWFYDANGVQHGFTDVGGVFTQIDYPGNNVAYTVLEGINDSGLIVGQFEDNSGILHSFQVDSAGTFKEFKVPGATSYIQAFDVNNAGFVTLLSDAGPYIYCPLSKVKCGKLGATVDVDDARPINKPAGYFVVFNPAKLANHGTLQKTKLLPKGASAQ
jgi:probable HAF family extracellular repeat protein